MRPIEIRRPKPDPVPAEIRARRIELLRQRILVANTVRELPRQHFLTIRWPT